MRQVTTTHYHSIGNQTERVKATIDMANMAHVMNHLSDLYEDPLLAVMREYSTNALDSHIAAGNTGPIRVYLPTSEDPNFVVQDFGLGLSIDELRHVYLSYGASDKRDSDDFVGMLGFGSKSGTTYAPLGWQVEAIKDGERVLATVARDAEGVPEMSVLFRGPTDRPNGVKITIPIKDSDVFACRSKAEWLYSFWAPGTVVVDDDVPGSIHDEDGVIWIEPEIGIRRSSEGTYSNSYVVMGNVPYRVNRKSEWGYDVIAFVDIGAVEIPPSRESLKMTDHTQWAIDAIFEFVDHHAERVLVEQAERAAAVSPWNVLLLVDATRRELPHGVTQRYVKATRHLLPLQRHHWRIGQGDDARDDAPVHFYDVDRSRGAVSTYFALTPSMIRTARYDIERTCIVDQYPYRTTQIAPSRRQPLRDFARDMGCNRVVVLPGKASDVEFLQGSPHEVRSWEQVKKDYPAPRVERARRNGGKTIYDLYRNGVHSGVVEDGIAVADGPIVFQDNGNRWSKAGELAYQASRRFPHIQVVAIRSTQTDKFRRLYPTAVPAIEFEMAERERIAEATKDEGVRLAKWAGRYQWLDGLGLDDPDLVAVTAAASVKAHADLLAAASRLNFGIDYPEVFATIHERYPLLQHIPSHIASGTDAGDLALYLNAKYQEVVVAEAMAMLEEEFEIEMEADLDA